MPKHLIEDAVQEVMLKVVRQRELFCDSDEMRRLQALSHKIMHDTAADLIRRRDRHRPASLDALRGEPMDRKLGDPADLLSAKELGQWAIARVEELRKEQPQYAWLLSEHFLKERPLEELAAAKGVTKHAMECQQTRALEALRRLMVGRYPDGDSVLR